MYYRISPIFALVVVVVLGVVAAADSPLSASKLTLSASVERRRGESEGKKLRIHNANQHFEAVLCLCIVRKPVRKLECSQTYICLQTYYCQRTIAPESSWGKPRFSMYILVTGLVTFVIHFRLHTHFWPLSGMVRLRLYSPLALKYIVRDIVMTEFNSRYEEGPLLVLLHQLKQYMFLFMT
jgi:hypothetical protein